jgi:hypothetical protein
VTAHRTISPPQLIFSQGWWESMSENSVELNPPIGKRSKDLELNDGSHPITALPSLPHDLPLSHEPRHPCCGRLRLHLSDHQNRVTAAAQRIRGRST